MSPREVRQIRQALHASQPRFATYLTAARTPTPTPSDLYSRTAMFFGMADGAE
jgi:hypothetical protein